MFNKDNNIDDFTFIIARRDFYKYGAVKADNVRYKNNFNGADEASFRVHKLNDMNLTLWDRINDYNIVIIPELGDDGYFEMDVELSEDTEGVCKNVTLTSLAEAELSHVKIFNYEVNTEAEMTNDDEWSKDYHTVFYRRIQEFENDPAMYKKMKHASLLHRILDKVPNYTIEHVDATLLEITDWYQFSWDNQDIYSILTGDVAEQYHVWFKFNSKKRSISVYDLYSVCQNDDCSYRADMKEQRNIVTRYRGDFHQKCPYCGSTNITPGYGKFTKIFISKDNLSTSANIRSNKDSLINTFKIKSGDDLMDAAVMNQNPNGSNYIYQFSEECKEEMPQELVNKLEEYTEEYNKYYYGDTTSGKGIYNFTNNEVSQYNALVNTLSGKFDVDELANFLPLKSQYKGYNALSSQFYSVLDLEAFYEYSMAPQPETNNDSLSVTKALLEENGSLSPIAVMSPSNTTEKTIENAILQSANCIINTALYELTVNTTSWAKPSTDDGTGVWKGTITIVSIEDKGTDKEQANTITTKLLTISVNNDMATYVKQKVDKLIARKNAQILPLTKLVNLSPLTGLTDYTGIEDSASSKEQFKQQLKYYSLDILTTIVNPAFQDTMSIIIENSNKINEIFYDIYHTRLQYIQDEIVTRTAQLKTIKSIKEKIENYRDATKSILNFQDFLGERLYNIFCSYRREDTYQNQNFISDNLDNSTIMKKAGDLIDFAQKELYKCSNLQFEVTGNLNNLLALPEFSSIFDDFEVGNWIHMSVDDKVYNLRLLSYEISFDEIQNISVEFSTVEKIWSGSSDIQSVLKSAGSIAGSYSNTQQQLNRVQDPYEHVKSWVNKGLEATKTKFVDDSVTQEIVYDSSGLYARGYDEITDTYYPQQLKINKNGMYLTDDNWEHIRTGVGAFTYYDPDPEVEAYVDSYGIIANTVVGKLFLGENLKIFNQAGSLKMTNDGFEITNGVNSFVVNPNNPEKLMVISNVNQDVLWVDENGLLHIRGDGAGLDINGLVTANNYFKINLDGSMESIAGKIGGWDIYRDMITKTITSGNNNYQVWMHAGDDITSTSSAFAVRSKATDSDDWAAQFYVRYDGYLEAKNAKINGAITATTLSTGLRTSSATGTNGTFIDGSGNIYVGPNNQTILYANGNVQIGGANGISYNTSNNTVSMGNNVVLAWSNLPSDVASESSIPTDINQLSDASGQKWSTTVGDNWLKTKTIIADYINTNTCNIGPFDINEDGLYTQKYIDGRGNNIQSTFNADGIWIESSGIATCTINCSGNIPTILLQKPSEDMVIQPDRITGPTALYIGSYYTGLQFDNAYSGCITPAYSESLNTPVVDFGSSEIPWNNIYANTYYGTNNVIQTSDKKEKDILGSIDYATDLIMSLTPTRYMWKNGDHRRTRMGFIAQDVAKVCNDLNQNLALVTASYVDKTTGDYFGEEVEDTLLKWGLSYTELIAPMIAVIQQQQKQITQLQNELNDIKQKI